VNVWSFLQLMKRAMKIDDTVEEKKSPLIIESIDADGIVKRMQL